MRRRSLELFELELVQCGIRGVLMNAQYVVERNDHDEGSKSEIIEGLQSLLIRDGILERKDENVVRWSQDAQRILRRHGVEICVDNPVKYYMKT